MANAKKRQKSPPNASQAINEMLGQSLGFDLDPKSRVVWLKQIAQHTHRQFIELEQDNEVSLGRALLESFGDTWNDHYAEGDTLQPSAFASLADFIGLNIALQESAGLGKEPFCSPAALWNEIRANVISDDDSFDVSDCEAGVSECCREVLVRILQASGEELPSELLNSVGYPSKAAQQDVLAFLEQQNSQEQPPDDDERIGTEDEDDPLAITRELALGDRPVDGTPESQNLDTLMQDVGAGLLQLDPPWQRGDVWGLRKKRALIDSVMLGIPLPSLIFHLQKSEEGETITVIDGKQRLTALHQFYDNQWKLGRYPERSPLSTLSGKSFAELTHEQRSKFKRTQITCINFENLPTRVLYRIFELYNISGIRLNATEIRNAVFHEHPIHKMLFSLAGESVASEQYILEQHTFTALLRSTISTKGTPPRFSAIDFLERYLAYSRVPRRSFTPISTTKAIQLYYEGPKTLDESPVSLAAEIATVFGLAHQVFSACGANAFAVPSSQGKRPKFSKLRATTSLILARILFLAKGVRTFDDATAIAAIRHVESTVQYPDKQQTRSIWTYQARCAVELVRSLSLTAAELENARLQEFIAAMDALCGGAA